MNLSIAYSTCPNDTFVFHALVSGLVECRGAGFKPALKDVEALNQEARSGRYDITKLSFAAVGNVLDQYGLLRSGAALGRGCGPLVVARPGITLSDIGNGPIAVPGLWTTANLLLGLFLEAPPDVKPMRFDEIMPGIAKGDFNLGVVIHEGRFTYQNYGLSQLIDLGEWWEKRSGLPIPLGGIVARRTLPVDILRSVEHGIANSVRHAFADPGASNAYVRQYAQEMDASVIEQHIALYVNRHTIDLGETGVKAVETLFALAAERGLIKQTDNPLFAVER